MTGSELLSDFDLGPGDQRPALLRIRLFSMYLADHVQHLSDAIAFREYLLEISAAARFMAQSSQSTKVLCAGERGTRPAVTEKRPPAPQPRWDATCPLCGHIHGGDAECGMPIGGGRVCRCEFDGVPA